MKTRNNRSRARLLRAVVHVGLIASFSFALLLACADHTDDGCPVEFHCFACHWAFAGNAVTTALILSLTGLPHVGAVAVIHISAPAELPAPFSFSRGPPLS